MASLFWYGDLASEPSMLPDCRVYIPWLPVKSAPCNNIALLQPEDESEVLKFVAFFFCSIRVSNYLFTSMKKKSTVHLGQIRIPSAGNRMPLECLNWAEIVTQYFWTQRSPDVMWAKSDSTPQYPTGTGPN
jgi:hypothetical protein